MTTQPGPIHVHLIQEGGSAPISAISSNVTSDQELNRFFLTLRNLDESRPTSPPQIKFQSRDGIHVRVRQLQRLLELLLAPVSVLVLELVLELEVPAPANSES